MFCTTLFFAQNEKYSIKNLNVNTKYSDFGTTYYGDSIVIYASSKPMLGKSKRKWKTNKQPYLQLYSGKISSKGQIYESMSFSEKINSKYHESNVAFSKDLKTVYFSRDNSIDGKKVIENDNGWVLIQLYKATLSETGEWENITSMPFNSDNYQTGHPSLNEKGDKLYFISDMPGGYGLTDIYVVDINEDGTSYGDPKNLGAIVNTSNKEMFPFIDGDNTLYFSSERYGGLGGLDIYATKANEEGKYYNPINLGSPLNSPKDDFSISFHNNSKTGHFSSNRGGGKGDDDIYYFEKIKSTDLECHQIVRGVVRDENTQVLLPDVVVVLYKEAKEIERVITGSTATFTFNVNCESKYKIIASKENYKDVTKEFTTTDEADLELNIDLSLNKKNKNFVEVRGEIFIKINPIYFDYNKSFIRDDAKLELAKVINVMRKYPSLIVEGRSHTDSRGGTAYNQKLSERRADSTVRYIIRLGGISPNRISAIGYGETRLMNHCLDGVRCSDYEHELNRRTEFVILNPEVLNQ